MIKSIPVPCSEGNTLISSCAQSIILLDILEFGGISIVRVLEYFATDNQKYWLSRIGESDWVAGQYLHGLLKTNQFHAYTDENARVLMLAEGNNLISFCTLSDQDDIESTDLKPWIGFVYTFPQYRGNRYVGALINYASDLAKKDGFSKIYVSTDQEGIYEKYKFEYIALMKDKRGGESRVYVRYV